MKNLYDYEDTQSATVDLPFGAFKNESAPGKQDGTTIVAEHIQDIVYPLYQILQLAGITPDGELEDGNSKTQFIQALTNIGIFRYSDKSIYNKSVFVWNVIGSVFTLYRSAKDNNNADINDETSWIKILELGSDNKINFYVDTNIYGDYLNKDLSDLSSVGIDKINQSKALETGAVSSDADVYADIQKYAHSTFDRSKFEVVGSPTISEDGVASGFSASNYIKCNGFSFSKMLSFKGIKFRTGDVSGSTKRDIIDTVCLNFDMFVLRVEDGELRLVTPAGNAKSIVSAKNNTNYIVDLDFNPEQGECAVTVIENDTTVPTKTLEFTFIGRTLNYFAIGCRYTGGIQNSFNGSIDLKSIAVWGDGVPVLNGNKTGTDTINDIEIPYTLSKSGSKIVDVAYRDRVQDLYEQTGEALFYTIDEENQNFTLPMGEIYGMISKNEEILDVIYPIGRPMQEINNELLDNEIWLEGATVSRTDYANLFNVYGTTYGEGDGSTTFQLPDLRDRVLWGSPDGSNGYIEAALPNIKGKTGYGGPSGETNSGRINGAFYNSGSYSGWTFGGNNSRDSGVSFSASRSSSIYSDNATTVQPPAFKVRWKTRFK